MQLCNQYSHIVTPLLESTFKQVSGQYSSFDIHPGLIPATSPTRHWSGKCDSTRSTLLCYWTMCRPLKGCDPIWSMAAAQTCFRSSRVQSEVSVICSPVVLIINLYISYPILKRRIAWVIGKWVAEACISPNDPNIWEILVHLLKDRGAGTDAVVQLTAAMALKECIDVRFFSLVDEICPIFHP